MGSNESHRYNHSVTIVTSSGSSRYSSLCSFISSNSLIPSGPALRAYFLAVIWAVPSYQRTSACPCLLPLSKLSRVQHFHISNLLCLSFSTIFPFLLIFWSPLFTQNLSTECIPFPTPYNLISGPQEIHICQVFCHIRHYIHRF